MSTASLLEEPSKPEADAGARRLAKRRSQKAIATDRLILANGLNVIAIVAMFALNGNLTQANSGADLVIATARLTGLLAMYACLVQLVLMSRLRWLNDAVGIDVLNRWHRLNGHAALYLMLGHVAAMTGGYAAKYNNGWIHEFIHIVSNFKYMLLALVALVLFIATVAVSIQVARRKLRYETWHLTHLYVYLAVALSVPHQVAVGKDFVGHPLAQAYWWSLFAAAFGSIVVFRIGRPIAFNLRHWLRVAHIQTESPDSVSIYFTGRNLDEMNVESGQYFLWRFLGRDQWAQAHPYSLSAAPNGRFLRITVKGLGDHSAALRDLAPGTRVFVEGPYGAFSATARMNRRVLLVAAGIGITPVRALLESLDGEPGDISVIYRVNNFASASLVDEMRRLAHHRGADIHMVDSESWNLPDWIEPLDTEHLAHLVPDIQKCDVYVCGPSAVVETVVDNVLRLGVQRDAVHYEGFAS